jgi:hypothetical protein
MLKKIAWLTWFIVLLLPASGWAKGVSIAEATDEQREAAKAPYIEGRKAFDEGRHEDALKQFQASYDIVASPNSHHMMAMAMRELGQFAQAYEHFGEVAAEADAAAATDEKYAKAADNARAKREEMMSQVGFINLAITNPDGARSLTIGGRPIERARWSGPIPANPGNNDVVLTLSNGEEVNKSLSVTAGETHDLALSAAAPEPETPEEPEESEEGIQWLTPYRITAYAVVGVGLISFGIAGGLGSAAQSKHDELATSCNPAPCPALEDDISSGESLQVATNVMVVVGAVLVAGGAALWVFAPDANGFGGGGGEGDDGEDDDDKPDFSMYVAPLPGGAMVGGQF